MWPGLKDRPMCLRCVCACLRVSLYKCVCVCVYLGVHVCLCVCMHTLALHAAGHESDQAFGA